MKTKLKWLDRSAFILPIYITLATSKKILDAELKRMKFKGHMDGVNCGAGATTNFMTSNNAHTCAIVCLFNYKGIDIKQVYSLLAHESVHIFQEVCAKMNEERPSKEFEAWVIQKIAQDLFYEFDRQTKGRK